MNKFYHYIISAAKAKKRRESILENFHRFGVVPNVMDAIMGADLTSDEKEKLVDSRSYLNNGAIGCALSHLAIYKKFLSTKEPVLCVFEDDARIGGKFIEEVEQMRKFVGGVKSPAVLILYKVSSSTRKFYPLNDGHFILHALGGTASHGYIINRKAAANILQAQTPLKFEIDAWEIYSKLGLTEIFCTDYDFVSLDAVLSAQSLIQVGNPPDYTKEHAKKENRKILFHELYEQNGICAKVKLQMNRFVRHLRELYYDKDD